MEDRIAYLRPGQIHQRLSRNPLVLISVGPLEWHGPHMPYGTDGLNAERVAMEVCRKVQGLLWPALFWGTERERSPQVAANLGFRGDQYIVGMDFPKASLRSSYCQEEIFAIVMRETLRQVQQVGARLAVVINGHGATNQWQVLERLANEWNAMPEMRVYVRTCFPMSNIRAGSIGHAAADETSMMMAMTKSVDIAALPGNRRPLRYADYSIVDGPGFDGKGPADKTVPAGDDPRRSASRARGLAMCRRITREITTEIRTLLKEYRQK